MKNKLIITSLILLFISCNKKESYNCNSKQAKDLVKSILKDEIKVEWSDMRGFYAYNLKPNNINSPNEFAEKTREFIDKYIEVEQIRTISKNKELRNCGCKGKIIFKIPKKVKDFSKKYTFISEGLESETKNGIDIEYNVQEENDNIYVESYYNVKDFNGYVMIYTGIKLKSDEAEEKETIKEKEMGTTNTDNTNYKYYESTVNNLRIRSKPSLKSETIGNLEKGGVFKVYEKSEFKTTVEINNQKISSYWYRIETEKDNLKGWVHGCCIKEFVETDVN